MLFNLHLVYGKEQLEHSSKHILCSTEKKKVAWVWNNMKVSKWWPDVYL